MRDLFVSISGWILLISVPTYMISLFQFVSNMKKYESAYWNTIGNPGLSNANDQVVVLKFIIFPKKLPVEILEKYKASIRLIRMAGLISSIWLLGLFALAFMEKYGY